MCVCRYPQASPRLALQRPLLALLPAGRAGCGGALCGAAGCVRTARRRIALPLPRLHAVAEVVEVSDGGVDVAFLVFIRRHGELVRERRTRQQVDIPVH